jgi:hypothetical protein
LSLGSSHKYFEEKEEEVREEKLEEEEKEEGEFTEQNKRMKKKGMWKKGDNNILVIYLTFLSMHYQKPNDGLSID